MKTTVRQLLEIKGYNPVFDFIIKSIRDLSKEGYSRGEIKETLIEWVGREDSKINSFIDSHI